MSLAADTRWRLRDAVRIDRVAELSDDLRERLATDQVIDPGFDSGAPDAAVVSRPGGRAWVVLVDADMADLLVRFEDGKSVAQVVLELARSREIDPHELLEKALPAVSRMVRKGYLVDADAPPSALGLQVGEVLGGWRIARVLSRLEDSEVHQVRQIDAPQAWGVLKLSTPDRRFGRPEHELDVLRFLTRRAEDLGVPEHQRVVPSLLDAGEYEGTGWFVLEHVAGVPVQQVAGGLRRLGQASRGGLLRLAIATVRAFADLHHLGVVHGDVHPDNFLVTGPGESSRVVLVDLGCSRRLDGERVTASRPGIDAYREPEVAAAILDGRPTPAADPSGEQYAVATVLFQLVTGRSYLDFAVDRRTLLRQITNEPPRSFTDAGAEGWASVEKVLHRALDKDPAERFGSMGELANALGGCLTEAKAEKVKAPGPVRRLKSLERAAKRARTKASPGGAWWPSGTASEAQGTGSSLYSGSAGLAWSLLHAAVKRGDDDALALADLWACRAERQLQRCEEAGTDEALAAPEVRILSTAPLHRAAGIHETAACVAWTRGDLSLFVRRAWAYLDASQPPPEVQDERGPSDRALDLDLALGLPGTLVSTAHLLSRARPPHADGSTADGRPDRYRLGELAGEMRAFGAAAAGDLWQRLQRRPEIAEDTGYLGFAHGWAGALYATLVWRAVSGSDLPSGCAKRLKELAREAVPFGRGLRWSRSRQGRRTGPAVGRDSVAGWCHGSAGYVLLFDTAAQVPQLSGLGEVAEAAAWDVWDRFVASSRQSSHLCCGLVGQAWSLLVHGRETGDDAWYRRAEVMAESAARYPSFDSSLSDPEAFDGALFKGEGSLPALLADLERPAGATWPWLEDVEVL